MRIVDLSNERMERLAKEARVFVAATKVRRRQYEQGRLVELHPRERWAWIIADILDAIETGIAIREARKTWWQRVGRRIFRLLEAVALIWASIASKRLPLVKLLEGGNDGLAKR